MNTDFVNDVDTADDTLRKLTDRYRTTASMQAVVDRSNKTVSEHAMMGLCEEHFEGADQYSIALTLIHRSLVKSYRDIIVYGIRIAMYIGLAIMMGTVWLRLSPEGGNIQAYTNAIVRINDAASFTTCILNSIVFRWSVHVVHGGRIYSRVP